MTKVLIIFMLVILVLALTVTLIAVARRDHPGGDDSSLYDEDGDHIYYDRSAIEKKEFARRNPRAGELRTFRRLFGLRRHK